MKRWKERVFLQLFLVLVLGHRNFLNALETTSRSEIKLELAFENDRETSSKIIMLDDDATETEFLVSIGEAYGKEENLRINLVLEYMMAEDVNCSRANLDRPRIEMEFDDGEKSDGWCGNFDYRMTKFQDLLHVSGDHKTIKITTLGNWKDVYAAIAVSIYNETTDCSSCGPDTFCCEGKKTCKGSPKIDDNLILSGPSTGNEDKPRCIPLVLRCDEHPNCGHSCNADESNETCIANEPCMSYPSGCSDWEVGFFWTAVLAVVFFVMAPTVIVFLICYHKQVNALEMRRRGGPVTVHSPPTDLPPTYDELDNDDPPPCFCSVASIQTETRDGGVDNSSFEPEARTSSQSFTCVCRGAKPVESN